MDKKQALERLNSIESEAKSLRKIIEAKEKVTDRIKTFEDACQDQEVDPFTILPYKNPKGNHELAANAFIKLRIIAAALNEGWKPDFLNSNESKYWPYFKANKATCSGFGFSNAHFGNWYSRTSVGSRLCFKSSDLAMYAGTQFESIYNDFLN